MSLSIRYCAIYTYRVDEKLVKVLKFTKNHGFHGNRHFSRKKAIFTENVTAG